jgi:hypothetical protein
MLFILLDNSQIVLAKLARCARAIQLTILILYWIPAYAGMTALGVDCRFCRHGGGLFFCLFSWLKLLFLVFCRVENAGKKEKSLIVGLRKPGTSSRASGYVTGRIY